MSQQRGKEVANIKKGRLARVRLTLALLSSLAWLLFAAGPAVSKAANHGAEADGAPSRLSVAVAGGAANPGVMKVRQNRR